MSQFIQRLKPDVIHLDDVSLRLGLVLPELPKIHVLNVHDPETHSGEDDWRRNLARWLMFRRTKRFILHNRAQLEPFCRRYRLSPKRVRVAHLGVYDIYREWSTGPPEQDERTVLFFGRVSAYKGLDVLYRAATRVAEQVPGLRLVVAGRPEFGYQPPPPPALANGARVEVLGEYISNARQARLFERATVVACPYVDATQSGVVLTAYAFDRPVVATRVGGLPEYVRHGETGLLVPPGDPETLAAALVEVLTDQTLRRRLAGGIASVKRGPLDWSATARQALDVYTESMSS